MPDQNEIIYDSPPAAPDDPFWLEQGQRMVTESLASVRSAATALISALGVIKAIYLGILGFAKFIPEDWAVWYKGLFVLPLLVWLIALYFCVQVVMTRKLTIYLHAPDNIKQTAEKLIIEKQKFLERGYWLLETGLVLAFALLIIRIQIA